MRHDDETYELACKRLAESQKALKILDYATGEEIWIPLSQIREMHFQNSTGDGTLVMTAWIARTKGLI